ncbi:MAG: hypothetical protein WA160_14025 [Pseudobdellovibrio sp.]
MIQILSHVRVLSLVVALSGLFTTSAFAAPAEVASVQIKRSATTANPALVTLSKNLFKTETYQAPYNVDVQYQDTETYVVQVPFQETETYTESVPYVVSVPYTDYETDYRDEYRCESVTRYRNECHNEQQCYIVPGDGPQCRDVQECGTNAQGQYICKTRQVCDGGSGGPQQRCENRQVCNNVPYTDQDCRNVSVPYQRQVTRYRNETQYRNETRTRTVTHYRNETRTREVTKTRTEEHCCVTKTREVFDRQLQFQVSVNFPQNAILAGADTEVITLKLTSADPAVIAINSSNSIYNYAIANQSVSGASILVDLVVVPKFDLSNAGPSTIQGLKVDFSSTYTKFRITFTDTFKSAKVASSYSIVVTDALTGNLIEEIAANKADASGKSVTRITTELNKNTKIIATVKVKRISTAIANGALEFNVAGKN